MFSILNVTVPLLGVAKKKADVAKPFQGFNHVGLLVNQPTGTAGRSFIESSEIEISSPTKPIPVSRRLRPAVILPFGSERE